MAAKDTDTFVGSIVEQVVAFGELDQLARREAINGMYASFNQATGPAVIFTALLKALKARFLKSTMIFPLWNFNILMAGVAMISNPFFIETNQKTEL